MVNKIVIQVILLIFILISLAIFYNKYFKDIDKPINQTQSLNSDNSIEQNNENLKSNLIYNLSYKSSDIENNQYFINSKSGTMSENGIEFSMNEVNAKIILNDMSEIIILSDRATYNNDNYNTIFYGNVVAKYGEHTIYSQKINLDFEIRLASIYEEVLYKNLNTKLTTDKIELDLDTKNILISMKDKEKKVELSSNY
jgi:hypothetical protein